MGLNYEEITSVTQDIAFLIVIGFVWISTIIIYTLLGFFLKSSSSSGRFSSRYITNPNFLWGLFVIIFWSGTMILLFIIFPLWSHLLS